MPPLRRKGNTKDFPLSPPTLGLHTPGPFSTPILVPRTTSARVSPRTPVTLRAISTTPPPTAPLRPPPPPPRTAPRGRAGCADRRAGGRGRGTWGMRRGTGTGGGVRWSFTDMKVGSGGNGEGTHLAEVKDGGCLEASPHLLSLMHRCTVTVGFEPQTVYSTS